MIKKSFMLGMLYFLAVGLGAQELKPNDWNAESNNKQAGKVIIADNKIELIRGNNGGDYMLRAFQDVKVDAKSIYQLSYKINVNGPGNGGGLIYQANKAGKWDELHIKYAQSKGKCDFCEVKLNVTAAADTVKFRIDLRARGKNTKIIYKEIKLEKVGASNTIVLTPVNGKIKLDGKLNDPLWQSAVKLAPFKVLGNVSRNSSVDNEVMLALKGDYLYVAYRLEEPNIAGMKTTTAEKFSNINDSIAIYADDCVETFISPDRKSLSHLLVNSASVKHWDQQNTGKCNVTWYQTGKTCYKGDWQAKAAIGNREWTVEMRIKLSSLFGKKVGGDQQLFVNFTRHRTQGNEPNQTWVPLSGKSYKVPEEFLPITLKLPALAQQQQNQSHTVISRFSKMLAVPKLLLAGTPVNLTLTQKTFKLPAKIIIIDKSNSIAEGVLKKLKHSLAVGRHGKAKVVCQLKQNFINSTLTANELKKMASPEAFKLELSSDKVSIIGRTKEGLLRGIATLILLANRAKFLPNTELPGMTLYDAPYMPFRGWLVGDPDPKAIKQLIDTAYLLRLNKLFIALDSFGGLTIFPFDTLPIGSKKTTKQQWIEVFNYAREHGIEPIPYFSSWGRVQYLKNMPNGIKLLVDDRFVIQKGYRNLDVANPKTHEIMFKLQQEIIDTLKPKGLCIAMDETHYGHTVTSAAAKAKKWQPSDWFITAINVNHQFLKPQAIKLYIYGDMIDPGQNGKHIDLSGKKLLAKLPNDMIILDWKYDGKQDYQVDVPSIKMFKDAGLPTIACSWFRTKNTPRLAHAVMRHQADGLCLTSWSTTKINELMPNLIRALALTAYYAWSPEDCDLAHLKFLPDTLVEGAAYWNKIDHGAKQLTSIDLKNGLASPSELIKLMGLPSTITTDFIATPFKNYRGVSFKVFKQHGQPSALVIKGNTASIDETVQNGNFSSGLESWQVENNGNGKIEVENEKLKLTAPSGTAFMRAFQDIRLDPKQHYTLRYKTKVNGSGSAATWTYSGDSHFNWDEGKNIYSNSNATKWTTKTIKLPFGFAAVRICFSANGAGSIAWFDNIELLNSNPKLKKKNLPISRAIIPINAKATVITFMHSTNHQDLIEDMGGMEKKYRQIIPGKYEIIYHDASNIKIHLKYRDNIVAINDKMLGRNMDVGLFGTVANSNFVNLPTFTWINPYPDKTIKMIKVIGGNSKDMSLILFGITLE